MPSGALFQRDEWAAVCKACVDANAWMVYDSAMERILFDGAPHWHPASFDGMFERTVTVGAASKEYRMIGWRVGWVVGPLAAAEAIGRVSISNVVCPVGIAQQAVAAAIEAGDDRSGSDGAARRKRAPRELEHDPEKWLPVFGKDHAPPKGQSGMTIRRKVISL